MDSTLINFMPAYIPLFEDDDTRWQAVQARDPNADGFFVYGVKTTKIFCRPICKARLARRANVRFYGTGEEAKEAGFRACKRCKPEVMGLMPEEAAVQKIRAFVRDREAGTGAGEGKGEGGGGGQSSQDARMSLSQMAKRTGLSKWHFHRVFKKCVGVTPVEYLKMVRDQALGSSVAGDDGSGDATGGGGGNGDGGDLDMSWMDQYIGDFDFACLNDSLVMGFSMDDSSATQSECSPLSFDDLLLWPPSTQ